MVPSVLWRCWLGGRKGIRPVKNWAVGAGVVICLERGADLHMAQLMPLPLAVSCFSKIQIGFTFLVPAHPGSPGQRAVKRVCVCACCIQKQWSPAVYLLMWGQRFVWYIVTMVSDHFVCSHTTGSVTYLLGLRSPCSCQNIGQWVGCVLILNRTKPPEQCQVHAGEEDHAHGLDGQHQDVDRNPRGRVSQNDRGQR